MILVSGRGGRSHLSFMDAFDEREVEREEQVDSLRQLLQVAFLEETERKLEEMINERGNSYGYGLYWCQDSKLAREEKVKAAQAYKKKNQRHPAFRK